MEVIIQFNNSIWRIGWSGIYRVTTLNWSKFLDTFTRLAEHQWDLLDPKRKEYLEKLKEERERAVKSAELNDRAIRRKWAEEQQSRDEEKLESIRKDFLEGRRHLESLS